MLELALGLFAFGGESCTLVGPEAAPPGAQIQLAERLGWTKTLDDLPGFERYPGM